MRIALGIEYIGTHYYGWQQQQNLPTVQGKLQEALAKVADHSVELTCAGRTDAGVHATGQVAHFDSPAIRTEYAWLAGANSHLPSDIAVRWVKFVEDSFHARFSALARRYCYIIYNHPVRSALYAEQTSWQYQPLDLQRMQQAAQYLVGEHDFSAFRAAGCQAKTAIRSIEHLQLVQQDNLIVIDIKANAFLHHMVRNITGVLLTIGQCQQQPEWAKEVLMSCDRRKASITAPPSGLYLVQVSYPKQFEFPATPALALPRVNHYRLKAVASLTLAKQITA